MQNFRFWKGRCSFCESEWVSEVKWSDHFSGLVFLYFFLCYRECPNFNFYMTKKVQDFFLCKTSGFVHIGALFEYKTTMLWDFSENVGKRAKRAHPELAMREARKPVPSRLNCLFLYVLCQSLYKCLDLLWVKWSEVSEVKKM